MTEAAEWEIRFFYILSKKKINLDYKTEQK